MTEEQLKQYGKAKIWFGAMVSWGFLSLLMFLTLGRLSNQIAVLTGIGVISAFVQGWMAHHKAKGMENGE